MWRLLEELWLEFTLLECLSVMNQSISELYRRLVIFTADCLLSFVIISVIYNYLGSTMAIGRREGWEAIIDPIPVKSTLSSVLRSSSSKEQNLNLKDTSATSLDACFF